MNELFEFHGEINVKKVLIVIAIIIAIIFMSFIFFKPKTNNNTPQILDNKKGTSIFVSADNAVSIEFSKKYEFSEYTPVQDYILELRSPNSTNIFVSHKDFIENKTLENIASGDRNSYIKKFKSYSNLSDISELTLNGNSKAYSYSFHYLNNKMPYYLQIFWIETENGYYTIDIEFPLDSLQSNLDIINDLITTFKTIDNK